VPPNSAVTMRVLNSTNRNNLARNVATTFGHLGFHVTGFDNDPNPVTGVAEIRYGSKGAASATLVSFYLPGAKLVAKQSSDSEVEVSLGAKFQSVATATQAKKTMTQHHVKQLSAKSRPLAVTPSAAATSNC
jgi:hypothetical protein